MVFIIKNYIKILAFLLAAALISSCFITSASADNVLRPVINVTSTSAIPGDTVAVNVSIAENPGIMAMTFTLVYDKDIFTFVKYNTGILIDYTIVDHPDKGYVSFVNCESRNRKNNGTLFTITFTVNDNAQVGTYDMKVQHIRPEEHGDSMSGCLANWMGDTIIPTVNNGTVSIGYTGTNCKHNFGEWVTTVPAMCEENGIKTHTCTICGHSAAEEIEPIGHKWQNFWTIDREATASVSGVMSRHCERCSAVTDKKTFTATDASDNNFTNTIDREISPDTWHELKDIIDKSDENQTPTDTSPNDSDSQNPSTETPDAEITLPENADQLIANANLPMGLGARIYRLFWGTQSTDGIFTVIKNSAPQNIRQLFEKPLFFISLFAFILLI